ncbi:MAG: DUF4855 domain-containing protein [Bacteroidales bacterium]|jgi:hypothetical protein|nr:DUF4855 domain-containing protein [Bacteroidales bacterium]
MVNKISLNLVIAIIGLLFTGCICKNEPKYVDFYWEKERKDLLSITDMVLIYGGGKHRDVSWNKDHFVPYVSYKNRSNRESWLFDGFLFLEIANGDPANRRIFATGYYGQPAGKQEWKELADYYFTRNNGIYGLDSCIADASGRLGTPPAKRKVIIGIPEPIVAGPASHYTELPEDYWGDVDGKVLNFTNNDDRIAACIWFIDYIRKCFNEGRFKNVELAGFYWIAEESLHTKTILSGIASYLNEKKYSFNWIPYWKTNPDYYDWKSLKFNYAYLQPNYFFNDQIPYSRLTEACNVVKQYDLDLELEFDMRVFEEKGDKGYRLYDYMKAFRENGVLSSKRIAYYQDCDALYHLYHASNEKDKILFHDFCSFVAEHQARYTQ